ncbi:MAG: sterol desaturase family protein [Planctomycetota bacterium]|nr:sterol desaturase family protein [Planctomycetota bacterium]
MKLIIPVVFGLLLLWTLIGSKRRAHVFSKSWQDWALDIANLSVQGTLVPWLQTGLLFLLYQQCFPQSARHCLPLGLVGGFFLNFIFVDYVYYWNHRLLHSQRLWPTHKVHHTVTDMDVFATSRNTLWTSFLICYLWLNSIFLFLLDRPEGYLLGAAVSASLDLWKHSTLHPWPWLERCLSPLLILPRDHAWHHGRDELYGNYGANLKIWDQIHGTWHHSEEAPSALGVEEPLSLARKLLWPFP